MRQLARGVKLLVWPGLLVIGMPIGLTHMPDRPSLPRHMPTSAQWATFLAEPLTREGAMTGFIAVGWLGWAILVYAILTDLRRWAARMRRRLPQLRLPGPLQSLSAAILGAVAVSSAGTATSAAPPAVHIGLTQPSTGGQPGLHLAAHMATPAPRAAGHASPLTISDSATSRGSLVVQAGDQHYTYKVHHGDTLWHIADRWLGDPTRWPEIYHLNQDHYDQHGRMRHGNHIQPGWVLVLPDDATPPPGVRPVSPPWQPGSDGRSARKQTGPAAPAPRPSQATTPPAHSGGGAPIGTVAPPATSAASAGPATANRPQGKGPVALPPGVVTASAPSATASSATGHPTQTTDTLEKRSSRPGGVPLPGGSWVDLGLALAVATAVALVWAHRRHRYTPRSPSPDLRLADPDLAPMPPVVAHIRRGLRRMTAAPTRSEGQPGHARVDRSDDLDELRDNDPQQPAAAPTTLASHRVEREMSASGTAETAVSVVTVPAAARPVTWPPDGLGLTGPGALAAARGFLVAALAAGGLDDPDGRTEVVMPSATAATLLGAAASRLPETPRLTVTAGLGQALELLEAHTLHRARLLDQQEVTDIAGLRHASPYTEPLPPIVLIADGITEHEKARVAALLADGQRLQIHGVLHGPWATGTTIVVADDGTTASADDERQEGGDPGDVDRLTVLNPTETLDLIATLAESHTGLPNTSSTSAAASSAPGIRARITATDIDPLRPANKSVSGPVQQAEQEDRVSEASTRAASLPLSVDTDPSPAVHQSGQGHASDSDATDSPADSDLSPVPVAGTVAVTVLGGVHILDADPGYHLRAKALELLVYLIVHDGAARHDAILDDLIPEAPASKAPHRMHTYVSSLRQALRRTNGHAASFVNHTPLQYTLTTQLFDIDLWRMRDALRAAQHATDPQTRAAALRRAIDTYQGPLAAGFDYEWIEPYRHAIRQQVLDAYLALAETLDGQPTQQLPILHAAIDLDPHAEPAYQQAMRAHAALGDLDAIRALRRTLARRLTEIEAEPGDDTLALVDQLVTQLQHRPRTTGARRDTKPSRGAAV